MNLPLLLVVIGFFIIVLVSYAIKDADFVSISIICSFTVGTITAIFTGVSFSYFIENIEFQAIIVILGMSIITSIAQESNILEYLAVKLFKISKGNQRVFFYLLCIITTLLAAIITDVVVVLILAPVVIRLCRFLKIKAGTYLLGSTICINIGSIITPFSSGENIIISSEYGLDTLYFIQNYWIFSFALLFVTIFLIDFFILKKEPKIDALQRKFILELVDAKVMIKDKRMFYLNSMAITITIFLFAIIPELYLVAGISAFSLILINKKFTKKKSGELFKDVEWEIIFFFISLYIIIASLLAAGFKELFLGIPFQLLPTPVLSIILLVAVSLISGFVANTPTALVFIPIVRTLTEIFGFPSLPIYFVFIIGINLGGNIIPQGSACDVMTLKVAQDNGVENMNYKRLLKVGATFAFVHMFFSIGYLLILVSF